MNPIGHEKPVSQYVEEISLLWLRREHLIGEPHLALPDFLERDEQLQARLTALVGAGEAGWKACERELVWEEPGEVFPATYLALTLDESPSRFARVLDYALRSPELARPVVAGCAWKSLDDILDPLEDLLTADDARLRRLGLAAALAHRQVPESALAIAIEHSDPALRARALRGVGEMGCVELLPSVVDQIEAAPPCCQLEAAWSCALRRRHPAAIAKLLAVTRQPSGAAERVIGTLMRAMDVAGATKHVQWLAAQTATQRLAVSAAAALGNPELVEWLISGLDQAALARLAGEALTMITGLSCDDPMYQVQPPSATCEPDPNDPGQDVVESGPDEHLPWPDRSALVDWWLRQRDCFAAGRRYLLGRPITADWCCQVLRHGRQRQRAAAAQELALLRPTEPLFEVRAPASRQESALGPETSGEL